MLPDNKDKRNIGQVLAQIVVTMAIIAITIILILLIIAVVATVFKGLFWYLTFLFC